MIKLLFEKQKRVNLFNDQRTTYVGQDVPLTKAQVFQSVPNCRTEFLSPKDRPEKYKREVKGLTTLREGVKKRLFSIWGSDTF